MLWTALLIGILGVLFGVVMSRTLTAPLRRLAEAAQAIGARDFSRRVEVKGTEEVREVAQAFNEMVTDLEQAETLRSNLLADVAHELRTPLSVLQGNLRAILDEVYPMEQEEIARLYDQTRLLGRLVEDLHELAQAEAKQLPLNLQPIELRELVQDVVETFGPAANSEETNLSMDIPDNLPAVEIDPARMTQVLHNLLSNALRHTPSGGTISVSAGQGEGSVWLAVQDTGEGIPPEDLPHVFDRFYRVDRARARGTGGAGLGLAIVRAIVEMHGGNVWADSDGVPGHGSRITIRIPIAGNYTGSPGQENMLT
jgi:signal transduction histidine kinase